MCETVDCRLFYITRRPIHGTVYAERVPDFDAAAKCHGFTLTAGAGDGGAGSSEVLQDYQTSGTLRIFSPL